jgi:L-talarate/galactarate dehydratase
MNITRVEPLLLSIPAPRRRVSLTDPRPATGADVLAVRLHTDTDHVGLGFATVPAAGTALRALIETDLAPLVTGEDPVGHEALFARAVAASRTVGWGGLFARAYAAIDLAVWDLKGKAAGLPLHRLIGGVRSSASFFVGDLAPVGSDAAETIRAARPLIDQGALGVAVDVGGGEVQADADRVQQIRDGIGESAWLGIAVEGRYDLATALAMAHFYEEDVGIDWIDFPIPVEDRVGYQRLAERMEVPLALGSSFADRDDFRRALDRGEARVLRPDVFRLGGLTPVLKVAALAEAFPVTVVPCRAPEVGVHLACGLPNVPMAEWGSGLSAVFAKPVVPTNGKLVPPDGPGLGLELSEEAVGKYRVA